MKTGIETIQKAKILSIEISPGVSFDDIDSLTCKLDAVIILGYASGATPEALNSIIKKRTAEGIPVFIVSANYKNNNGILDPEKYDSLKSAKDAGAVHIQTLNINSLPLIEKSIQQAFSEGKRGLVLSDYIKEEFSLKK